MTLDLSQHLPFRLAVLSNYIKQGTSDSLAKKHNMTGRDWRVMAIIGIEQPVTPASIAEITGIERVTVTRAVQNLEAKGLVEKLQNQSDGRSILIQLTPEGKQHWQPMMQSMKENGDDYRSLLTDGEFKLLLELLGKLQNYSVKQLEKPNND